MTVVRLERHLVDGARRAAFEGAVNAVLAAMRTAQGFLWADAARSMSDDALISVSSEWRSVVDHDAFVSSAAHAAFRDAADVCCREDASVRVIST